MRMNGDIPHMTNPLHGGSQNQQFVSRPPTPPTPPTPVVSNRSINPFLNWKTHELQEWLINNHANRQIVMHMHVKRDLALAALRLCNSEHNGVIPERPQFISTHHAHTDTRYVKRSAHSYHQARLAQHIRQKKMNRYQAGSMLQKHGMSRHVGHGPSCGSSFNGRLPHQNSDAAGGKMPSRQQTHEIFHATGMHSEEGKEHQQEKRKSFVTNFTRPSKLEAMAFAVEHSPRDWIRYEQEVEDMEEIKRLKNILNGKDENGNRVTTPLPNGMAKNKLKIKLRKLIKRHEKNKYRGPSNLDDDDIKKLRKKDYLENDGRFSHAYEVPMYKCCGASLGRHCPSLVITCGSNCICGKHGCQLNICELCCDPCGEKTTSDFGHYGVGISLYFKFLKWLGWTSFLMFLIVVPEIIINTFGTDKGAMLDSSMSILSLGHLGEVNGTINVPCWGEFIIDGVKQCPMKRSEIAWLYSLLDCSAMALFFLSFLWLRKAENDEALHFNELSGISNVSDYTILVQSFPPNLIIKSSDPAIIVEEERKAELWLKDFFEKQIKMECKRITGKDDAKTLKQHQFMDENNNIIHSVIAVSNQKSAIEFQKSMAPKRRAVDGIMWKIRELEADKALAMNERDERNVNYIDKQITKQKKKRRKIKEWLRTKQKSYRKNQISYRRVPNMVAAFVTFSTDLGRRVTFERYGHGGTCHRLCCQSVQKRYHGDSKPGSKEYNMITKVNIRNAPEPSTMLWQNIGTTCNEKCLRRGCTMFVALTLIGLAAIFVYFAKTSDPSALGKECLNTTNTSMPQDSISMFGQTLSCEGWIREVARTNEFGDLSIACAPYTDSIKEGNIHLTSPSSLARTCGCRSVAFSAVRKQNKKVIKICENYLNFVGIQNGLQIAAVMSVIVVNIAYVVVAKKLGACESHSSLDGQESSVAVAVLIGSILNTGLVMLLVNARVDDDSAISSLSNSASAAGIEVSTVLQGKYSDFTANWYSDVGVAITITMIIYVFSPHVPPLLRYCRFNCKEKKGSTQATLNSQHVGPDFHHSIRYPQLSVVIFVSMAYSSGIPILYLIISLTAFTFYWVDKYLFTRWYRTPPQYDASISKQFTAYLPYAAILHMLFGTWMIANRRMFSSDESHQTINVVVNTTATESAVTDSQDFHQHLLAYVGKANGKKNDVLSCLNQTHVGPMLIVLACWLVFVVLDELWLVVGPIIRKVLKCITCGFFGGHSTIILRDDYMNEEEHMKQYGLSSYNIFDNPIYQAMFNIDQSYSSEHKHLESLLMTEMNTSK